jgi:hypothetical protein
MIVILWQDKLTAFAELQQENSLLKRRNDLLLETQAGIIVSRFIGFQPFGKYRHLSLYVGAR